MWSFADRAWGTLGPSCVVFWTSGIGALVGFMWSCCEFRRRCSLVHQILGWVVDDVRLGMRMWEAALWAEAGCKS